MERVLFLTHTDSDGALRREGAEVLRGARDLAEALGADLTVGLFGPDVAAAANSMAACGASRFLGATGQELAHSRYGTDVVALEALVRAADPTLVLAPATSRLARALPGAAERSGGRIDTRVTGVATEDGEIRIERWYYRQRLLATQTRAHRPWFLMVEGGVFGAWTGEAGTASVEAVAVTFTEEQRSTRVLGFEEVAAGEQTIRPDAEVLLVAGAGWTKKQSDGQVHAKQAEALLSGFLRATQASLGSSKSLVDQSGEGQEVLSLMTHLNQVGQTGATPRHPKGLATCCHGEEPHVVGWRFINDRRAINLDPNCGWARGKADVLYVADAFEVMEKVNALLGAEATAP